ncbi:hypothetical protein SAMN05518863_106316 [Candidatus Pantoea symbiotica]|uniref:Uncharacterized protein n=1 Tax=Candidatus Pantoea symbiotica TaxID=1884370 RepID=A0A1I3Z1D8_9GAMM|nr:hypothetical protein SAMN05518863_106316 [Pantoea symbiotica]SFU88462.1 hypothetical protein SAMN05518864_106315 [Pantoea sp. YR525]
MATLQRFGAFFVGCAFMRTWFNYASFCRGSCASAEVAMNGDPTRIGAFFVGCAFMRTWFNYASFCRGSCALAKVAINGDPTRIGAFFVGCAFMRTWFNDAFFCRRSSASAKVAMNGDPTRIGAFMRTWLNHVPTGRRPSYRRDVRTRPAPLSDARCGAARSSAPPHLTPRSTEPLMPIRRQPPRATRR